MKERVHVIVMLSVYFNSEMRPQVFKQLTCIACLINRTLIIHISMEHMVKFLWRKASCQNVFSKTPIYSFFPVFVKLSSAITITLAVHIGLGGGSSPIYSD